MVKESYEKLIANYVLVPHDIASVFNYKIYIHLTALILPGFVYFDVLATAKMIRIGW